MCDHMYLIWITIQRWPTVIFKRIIHGYFHTSLHGCDFCWSWYNNAILRRRIFLSSWIQVLACRLLGTKPLPTSMLMSCELGTQEQTTTKYELKYVNISFKKMHWQCRLQNSSVFAWPQRVYSILHYNVCRMNSSHNKNTYEMLYKRLHICLHTTSFALMLNQLCTMECMYYDADAVAW